MLIHMKAHPTEALAACHQGVLLALCFPDGEALLIVFCCFAELIERIVRQPKIVQTLVRASGCVRKSLHMVIMSALMLARVRQQGDTRADATAEQL